LVGLSLRVRDPIIDILLCSEKVSLTNISSDISSGDTSISKPRKLRLILKRKPSIDRVSRRVATRLMVIDRELNIRAVPKAP